MKISFITPVGSLQDFAPLSDFHLIIAGFVQPDSKYTKFFKSRSEYVVLDNNLFEDHIALPTEDLINRAVMVDADEVVAPDVLFDSEETVKSAIDFINSVTYVKDEDKHELPFMDEPTYTKDIKVMVVPQGKNPEDWIKCYQKITDIEGVDVIGLSCLSIPHSFSKITGVKTIMENRLLCVQQLIDEGLVFNDVEYHLLGCGNPLELMYQKQHDWIRSCDTSSPIVHGIHGILYDPYLGLLEPKVQEKLDFGSTIPKGKYKNILRNMVILKKLAGV